MMTMVLLLFVSHTVVKQINPFTKYNLIPRIIMELSHKLMDIYESVGLAWMPSVVINTVEAVLPNLCVVVTRGDIMLLLLLLLTSIMLQLLSIIQI